METVTGYVSHIVYRNSDNGYTVFHIEHDDGEVTCVGSLNYINEGELLEIQGEYVNHNVYGKQLKISHYKVKERYAKSHDLSAEIRYFNKAGSQDLSVLRNESV